jgi:O-antigen/teichoic acid export membrane protein
MPDDDESVEPQQGRSSFAGIPAASVTKNTVFSYVSLAVDMLVLLALTPFIVQTLGIERFGVWSLLWSVITLFEIVHMGMSQAVVKFVSEMRERDDDQGHRERVATIFWSYVAQGLVVGLLTLVSYGLLEQTFDSMPKDLVPKAQDSLLVLGFAAAIGAPVSMFGGVLLAHQRQWQAFVIAIVVRLAYAVAVLVILPDASQRLLTLALLSSGSLLLQQVCAAVLAWVTIPGVSVHPRHVRWRSVREVYAFSVHFVLITAAYLIATRVHAFIIEAWLDVHAIALYALALRMSTSMDGIATRIQRMLTPVFAELHSRRDSALAITRLIDGTRVSFALTACGAGGAIVLAEPLIRTWVGHEMIGSVPILRILLGAVLFSVVYEGVRGLLSMSGHHALLARAIFAGQILNLGLAILLVGPLGLIGVAMGTFLGMLPIDVFVFQRALTSNYGISAWEFLRRAIGPSILPGFVAMLLLAFASSALQPTTLLAVAVLEVVAIGVFGVLYWVWSATETDKAFVRRLLGSRRSQPTG